MAFYLQTGKLILKDHSTITLINCVLMVGFVCVCVCVCVYFDTKITEQKLLQGI